MSSRWQEIRSWGNIITCRTVSLIFWPELAEQAEKLSQAGNAVTPRSSRHICLNPVFLFVNQFIICTFKLIS